MGAFASTAARADTPLDKNGQHRLGMILDLRVAGTSRWAVSRARGVGLLRFGGTDTTPGGPGERGKLALGVGQLGLQFSGRLGRRWGYLAELNSQWDGHQRTALNVPEVFLSHEGRWGRVSLNQRLGFLIPPFSLEHPGLAWSTFFTLTPSAVNTWLAEEVRGWGAESRAGIRLAQNRKAALTAGVFTGNDPSAVLLSWRGWAMHDLQAGFNERVRLRGGPALTNPAVFGMPQAFNRPFLEVDDRWGFYAHAQQQSTRSRLSYGYWQNNADRGVLDKDHVYGWDTFFQQLAGRYEPTHHRWLLQGQWLWGQTRMGKGQPAPVENDFAAWYLLYSRRAGAKDRLSLRLDRFMVKDHDFNPGGDLNGQTGHALTAAYRHPLNNHADLFAEVVSLSSKRPMHAVLGLSASQHETQWQLGWRMYR